MERWDRSNLKAFLNETFRPRKLLAQKDAQLAELRLSQLKQQEALRLSQEAVAQRDARLAELGAHWTNVLAAKDAELAQTREQWGEALRLSQEAAAQKDAHLAASGDHWTKVLAEKDAELAQTRELWSEALRLSQEAAVEKDAHLAALADHWTEVLAAKDAELAQTREHWSEALRLSQEAVAERDARLVELAHDWTKFGRSLSQLRAYCRRNRMPERPIILCGYPKSGNTMTRLVYHNLIGVAHGALSETITYSRLNRLDANAGFPSSFITYGFSEPEPAFDFSGFPLMIATHAQWQPFWDDIGDSLFIYRNPLDTLVSLWYHEVKFAAVPVEALGLDDFVLKHLPAWIEWHVGVSANIPTQLRYEDLMTDALGHYGDAFRTLGVEFQLRDLATAVAFTSFEAVRKMEEQHQERHGHRADAVFRAKYKLSGWRDGEDVRFARSGVIGEWKTSLSGATIDMAQLALRRAGLEDLVPFS